MNPDPRDPELMCERLARSQYGLIGIYQARRVGMTDATIKRRVVAGRWQRVLPGVFGHGGAPSSWEQEATAAYIWAGDEAALCRRTAAAWWGIGGFPRELPIEVVMRHHRKSPAPHVVVHETSRLEPIEIELHGVIAITSVERTLFDLCIDSPWPSVRSAIGDALRQGLTGFPAMWRRLDELAARGRKGTRLFRHLLSTMDEGAGVTESMLELRVLEALVAAGLPRPLTQHVVMGERGSLGRVDFAYPGVKLAIEADSHTWHLGPGAFEADRQRDQRLIAAGWTVIRVTWQQLNQDLHLFLKAVRAGLTRSAGNNAQQVDLITGGMGGGRSAGKNAQQVDLITGGMGGG